MFGQAQPAEGMLAPYTAWLLLRIGYAAHLFDFTGNSRASRCGLS